MIILSLAMLFALPLPQPRVQWPLWDSYAAHFMQDDGRVVDHERDGMSTSEGASYAMFFALVANDRERYDLIYRWTVNNLAGGNITTSLPAWSWGTRPDGTFGIQDKNSASDADLWIAYDLIQAGRLWHNPKYSSAGEALLARIATEEVIEIHGLEVLLPGKTGFTHAGSSLTNPSYLPLFVLQAATQIFPQGPWKGLASSLPKLLREASLGGFAPDWIEVDADGAARPAVPLNGKATHPIGGYEAIRVYLWAGIAASATPYNKVVLEELTAMADAMKTRRTPPEFVSGAPLRLSGQGPLSFSAALVPFLNAANEQEATEAQTMRLKLALSAQSGLYGNPPQYYDQNLAMFSLGYTEHRYRILSNGNLEVPWTK